MSNSSLFYAWNNYRCAYEFHEESATEKVALLLIHPIGVGLSCQFWHRFIHHWLKQETKYPIYNPDLLGCGASAMPSVAYYPQDWADQLNYFIETVIQIPVIIIVQGGLFPIAIDLITSSPRQDLIKGLILSGPPTLKFITEDKPTWQSKLSWNLLFNSPLGTNFYRYARRRQFLESFSTRQLFAEATAVDEEWLQPLATQAQNLQSRYAVFSFLAGFWRQDYREKMQQIQQPTLIMMGDQASTVGRNKTRNTPEEKLKFYQEQFTNSQGCQIPGRNVLPYESTAEFVSVALPFVNQICT